MREFLEKNGNRYVMSICDNSCNQSLCCEYCQKMLHPSKNNGTESILFEKFESFDLFGVTKWMASGFLCEECFMSN